MTDHRSIRALMRSPRAMMEYAATGRLSTIATREKPSPLAAVLLSLSPRQLSALRNIKIGPSLGYGGTRTFATGHQALQWVYPRHYSGAIPADSYRIRSKEFMLRSLAVEDLIACCITPPDMRFFPGRKFSSDASDTP